MGTLAMVVKLFTAFILTWLSLSAAVQGLGPAYGGDEFARLKEVPPALIAARSSGSLTLTCSVTGSPTPNTAWYKDGTDLVITGANWADMGRFTCTAQNGFGVD